eukprot:superscaffoldBa00007055_g22184
MNQSADKEASETTNESNTSNLDCSVPERLLQSDQTATPSGRLVQLQQKLPQMLKPSALGRQLEAKHHRGQRSLRRAWAHIASEDGDTANATFVLSRWKVLFGRYQAYPEAVRFHQAFEEAWVTSLQLEQEGQALVGFRNFKFETLHSPYESENHKKKSSLSTTSRGRCKLLTRRWRTPSTTSGAETDNELRARQPEVHQTSFRPALPSTSSEEPSDEELVKAGPFLLLPHPPPDAISASPQQGAGDEELLEATLELDHPTPPPAAHVMVQPVESPASSSPPPPAAAATLPPPAPALEEGQHKRAVLCTAGAKIHSLQEDEGGRSPCLGAKPASQCSSKSVASPRDWRLATHASMVWRTVQRPVERLWRSGRRK